MIFSFFLEIPFKSEVSWVQRVKIVLYWSIFLRCTPSRLICRVMTSLTDKYPTFLNKESWCGLGEHPVSVVVTIVSNGRVPQNSSCQVDTVLLWKGKKHHSCHHHSPAAVMQVSKTDKGFSIPFYWHKHAFTPADLVEGYCMWFCRLLLLPGISRLYPSPWPLVFIHHHGLWSLSITTASGLYPSPWPLVFIHHHSLWPLSISMTTGLYPSP